MPRKFLKPSFLMGVFILGGTIGFPRALWAQSVQTFYSSFGKTHLAEEANPSARAAAMGSAFVGIADDASALFSNPAGLASLTWGSIGILSEFGWVNTFQETLLLGLPLGEGQGIGFSASYLGDGAIEGRDELGSLTSSYGANEWNGQAGWGMEIAPRLSFGAALRYSLQNISDSSYTALTPDFGVLFEPLEEWKLGLDYVLPVWGYSGTGLVSTLRAGASWNCILAPTTRFLASIGYDLESDSFQAVQAGAELSFGKSFSLRAGYQTPLQYNGNGGFSGLSFGAGLELAGFILDYAYSPGGELGDTQQFSFAYPFAMEAAQAPVSSSPKPAPMPAAQPVTTNSGQNNLTVRFDIPPDFQTQGETMESQGHPEEAISLYRQAIQQDPENAAVWMDLGKLYFRLTQKDGAIACFEKVLQIQPDNRALEDWLEKYKAQKP